MSELFIIKICVCFFVCMHISSSICGGQCWAYTFCHANTMCGIGQLSGRCIGWYWGGSTGHVQLGGTIHCVNRQLWACTFCQGGMGMHILPGACNWQPWTCILFHWARAAGSDRQTFGYPELRAPRSEFCAPRTQIWAPRSELWVPRAQI